MSIVACGIFKSNYTNTPHTCIKTFAHIFINIIHDCNNNNKITQWSFEHQNSSENKSEKNKIQTYMMCVCFCLDDHWFIDLDSGCLFLLFFSRWKKSITTILITMIMIIIIMMMMINMWIRLKLDFICS